MGTEPIDPRWPKLLSLAVHEFRTPITVVAGYIRMLLKERAGPVSDQQRKLLEEAEKSCGRLSALVAEMSDLSGLEGGTAGLNRGQLDARSIVSDAVAALAPLPDREITVVVEGESAPVHADATRLKTAIASLVAALRREVISSDRLVVRLAATASDVLIHVAPADQLDSLSNADPASLPRFDEWRGGSGLSLAIARRIVNQHGGTIMGGPGEAKAAAVIRIPRAQ